MGSSCGLGGGAEGGLPRSPALEEVLCTTKEFDKVVRHRAKTALQNLSMVPGIGL